MAVKLRLARWGAKKHPYYHIVAATDRSPRDGKFLETVGKFNPLQEGDFSKRVTLKEERVKYWLQVGAQPTDKVHKILSFFNLVEAREVPKPTKKHLPKAKAQARLEEAKQKAEAANQEAPAEA